MEISKRDLGKAVAEDLVSDFQEEPTDLLLN